MISRFKQLLYNNVPNHIPDKWKVEVQFKKHKGYWIDLGNPMTFNEKLQWLKLYDRKPEYTVLVDKYAVKEYVSSHIGNQYVIPTLGLYESFDEIDFETLPNRFVLKCTHDSGSVIVVTNKDSFDKVGASEKLTKALQRDYSKNCMEWPYKNVPHRIIAEQYMTDTSGNCPNDYKFFCFNGKVKCFKVDFDRFTNHGANYYNRAGELLPFGEVVYPYDHSRIIEFPSSLETMIDIAEKLAENTYFVRVDLYDINGRPYFGECTFFPDGGYGRFTDEEWDRILGDWIELPIDKKK